MSEFLDAYCGDVSPAGVLVVASDPSVGGGLSTGIAFTDLAHASRELRLSAPMGPGDDASARFWSVVDEARRVSDGDLRSFFSGVHLASAFPHSIRESGAHVPLGEYLPVLPQHRRACREHLRGLLDILRPQAIACVGRIAFEAVASVAENQFALAAEVAERGWSPFVLSREYADGVHAFPHADFRGFRARLVPVADFADPKDAALWGHARDTLYRLFRDAWA